MMQTYDNLTAAEKRVIEKALDTLHYGFQDLGVTLLYTDPASKAAEALAVYYKASKDAMKGTHTPRG